jgi:hypothetical protein
LINQLVIPITLLLSAALLRRAYSRTQLAGAAIIVAGTALTIVPYFSGAEARHRSERVEWYSVLLYILGQLPTAMSAVYSEKNFAEAALDVFFFTTITSWMQLAISWLFVPLQSLRALGGVRLEDIPAVFRDGARCFAGQPVPVFDGHDRVTGACGPYVPRVTMLFSLSGFAYGVSYLMLLKREGAVLAVISQGVALPLSNLAFNVAAFTGSDNVEAFSWWNVGGLLVVLAGFAAYRWGTLRAAEELELAAAAVAAVAVAAAAAEEAEEEEEEEEGGEGEGAASRREPLLAGQAPAASSR